MWVEEARLLSMCHLDMVRRSLAVFVTDSLYQSHSRLKPWLWASLFPKLREKSIAIFSLPASGFLLWPKTQIQQIYQQALLGSQLPLSKCLLSEFCPCFWGVSSFVLLWMGKCGLLHLSSLSQHYVCKPSHSYVWLWLTILMSSKYRWVIPQVPKFNLKKKILKERKDAKAVWVFQVSRLKIDP